MGPGTTVNTLGGVSHLGLSVTYVPRCRGLRRGSILQTGGEVGVREEVGVEGEVGGG